MTGFVVRAAAAAPPPTGVVINTTSLAQATVGASYSQTIAVSGGSGTGYSVYIVSAAPNSGKWLRMASALTLGGIPQMAEVSSVTLIAVDSVGNVSQPATFNLTAVIGNVAPPPSQYIWAPGFGGLTYNQPVGAATTYSGSLYQTDIALMGTSTPTVNAYCFFALWTMLEGGVSGTQGSYPDVANNGTSFFSQLVADAKSKGLNVAIQFNPGVFNAGTQAPTDAGHIPGYILQNSQFGAPLTNGSYPAQAPYNYGWYIGENTGYWANFITNTNVYNAMLAAIKNFAQQWDGNPNVEAFIMCADDAMYPDPSLGVGGSTFWTALTNLMLAIKSYFKHINVCLQIAGDQSTAGQQYVQTLVQNGILVSCSDTAGASLWQDTYTGISFTSISGTNGTLISNLKGWEAGNTYTCALSTGQVVQMTVSTTAPYTSVTFNPAVTGNPSANATINAAPPQLGPAMMAWMGVQSAFSAWQPPTPGLQSYSSAFMQAQEGDLWNTLTNPVYGSGKITLPDMVAACNNQVTGGVGYNASKLYVSIGNSSVWAARLAALQNLKLTQTAYPPVYNS